MLFSYQWLKEYVKKLPSPEKLWEQLSLHSVEVEGVQASVAGTLLDIDNKSMTHRPDLFSHQGLAREIAAVFKLDYRLPKVTPLPKKPATIQVKVTVPKLCPRYLAVELEVTVQSAPLEMQQRLQACGIKPINNVVDITNYVMLEFGQPMHAFAANTITNHSITVRMAKSGEMIETLDHIKKPLTDKVLVIADQQKPIAIAGVIGGLPNAVTASTTNIVLEVANFDAMAVRKSAKACGTYTASALRFEKSLPPQLVTEAASRAIILLQEYAHAKVLGITDINHTRTTIKPVPLPLSTLNRLTGQTWSITQVKALLQRLECKVNGSSVTPPWFRRDLHRTEDIIEEIVRLYGVTNIPEKHLIGTLTAPASESTFACTRLIRKQLAVLGLTEVYNYSFYGADLIKKVGLDPEQHVEIANPLSAELNYARTTLLPCLLETIASNQQQQSNLPLFEVGHIYFSDKEVQQLAIVVASLEQPYRTVRGVTEALLNHSHIPYSAHVIKQTGKCLYWNMYQGKEALELTIEQEVVGTIGNIDQTILNNLDIKLNVAFALLSIPVLAKQATSTFKVKIPAPFPAITLDLSLIVPEITAWQQIEQVVRQQAGTLLQSLAVFDIYRGNKIKPGKKSIAFRIVLQSTKRTLAMKEMEQWRARLIQKLAQQFGAQLRDK